MFDEMFENIEAWENMEELWASAQELNQMWVWDEGSWDVVLDESDEMVEDEFAITDENRWEISDDLLLFLNNVASLTDEQYMQLERVIEHFQAINSGQQSWVGVAWVEDWVNDVIESDAIPVAEPNMNEPINTTAPVAPEMWAEWGSLPEGEVSMDEQELLNRALWM